LLTFHTHADSDKKLRGPRAQKVFGNPKKLSIPKQSFLPIIIAKKLLYGSGI
jgi:hypothetical protein